MNYQTETAKLPSVAVKLKHGLLIDGKRIKTARVRTMLAEDAIKAAEFPDARDNAVLMQLALLVELTTFDDEDTITVAMLRKLSSKDMNLLQKAIDDADELDFLDS